MSALRFAACALLLALSACATGVGRHRGFRQHRAGVDIRAVLDDGQRYERYSGAMFLANAEIPTRTNSRYAIMHNKFLVVDGKHVQTGSFNYTKSAEERNAENIIVLWHQPTIAAAYSREWERLWSEADEYRKRN